MSSVLQKIEHSKRFRLDSLDLSRCYLHELPVQLFELKSLRYLNLSNNYLSTLPLEFSKLINLQSLELTNNRFFKFPDVISNLKSLKSLEFGANQLLEIPDCIGELKRLEFAYFYRNQIQYVSDAIGTLSSLKVLSLNINDLSAFPAAILNLKNLSVLCLNRNAISTLPHSISDLQGLKELYLSSNQLSSVSHELFKLPYLEVLDLGYNTISCLSAEIKFAQRLKVLHLNSTPLVNWDLNILKCTALEKVSIFPEQLKNAPLIIQDFISERLPSAFKIPSEIMLEFKEFLGISDPVVALNTTSVRIEYKHLTAIPRCVFYLRKLETLKIINCNLMTVSDDIASLSQLKCLHLHSNQIETLPDCIGSLTSLEEIDLSNNQIKELPQSFSELSKLTVLKLHNNMLSFIPNSVVQLENLEFLDIKNNPFVYSKEFDSLNDIHAIRKYLLMMSGTALPCTCSKCSMHFPTYFSVALLVRYWESGRRTIVCPNSLLDVALSEIMHKPAQRSVSLPVQHDLTVQEVKIAEFIMKGYSNKQIADMLFISVSTVKCHVQNLYRKLDVNNRKNFMVRFS